MLGCELGLFMSITYDGGDIEVEILRADLRTQIQKLSKGGIENNDIAK